MAEVEAKRKCVPFEFIDMVDDDGGSLTKTFFKRLRVMSRERLQLFDTETVGVKKKLFLAD